MGLNRGTIRSAGALVFRRIEMPDDHWLSRIRANVSITALMACSRAGSALANAIRS